MHWSRRILLGFGLAISVLAVAQSQPAAEVKLPVRRVVLYKAGIGYFEHSGRVVDSQQVQVNFTTSQLNDVLKSLTVLDRGNGKVTGISYNSIAPVEQRLRNLRLPLGESTSQAEFLNALRGARIEVRNGAVAVTGRLLAVESRPVTRKDETRTTIDTLTLVAEGGLIRSFELAPTTSVRILEQDLNQDVNRYLNVITSAREQDVRHMTISTSGTGARELMVSYISEVPVWKSTYRIVLPTTAKTKALLQGWAIVDNTVGEDWKDVQLSLVAGAPQSFIQALSTPYYARRPVIALPQSAVTAPQTHERVLNDGARSQLDAMASAPAPPPPPAAANRPVMAEKAAKRSPGAPSGASGGTLNGAFLSKAAPVDLSAELLESQQSAAETRDLGDLFEYQIKEPVTIGKDQSALVPILQARVDAEVVTLWTQAAKRPLRALWLTNSSGLMLDGGTFNVLEGGAFAGEGLIEPLKAGEKRFLSYAADLGVQVESKQQRERQRVTRVKIVRGVLTHTTEWRERRVYTVRNENADARTVIIEHPVRDGMKLVADAPAPAETTSSTYRFRLNVEPKKTASLTVEEQQPTVVTYQLTNLTTDQIALFVQQGTVNSETEKALRGIITQKSEVAALAAAIESRQNEVSSIFEDQERVRENLKSLKGTAEEKELTQRYTRQLNQQEDRVQALRNEMNDLKRKREQAQAQLNRSVESLALDATL